MRILLLHQFFILDSEPGGSRHIFLCRFFKKSGAFIRVIAGSVNYMSGKSRLPFWRPWKKEVVDGIEIIWVYCAPTLKWGLAGKFISYFSFFLFAFPVALFQKADVMIATSPPPTVALLGWFVRMFKRIPWVLEIRDIWPEMISDLGVKNWFGAMLLSKFMDLFYRSATHLVTLTPGLQTMIRMKGIAPEKITTITNGVDPIFLTDFDSSPTALPYKKGEKFCAMYLGSTGIANRLETLLKVAESLKQDERIEFVFIGDGSEKERLLSIAKEKNLFNVHFFPPVPRKMVPQLLRSADICLLTHAQTASFKTLLPNRLFDYLAAGRPVLLCLKEGDASEVLARSGGGLQRDPDDLPSIREALLHLLEHPEERERMGVSGREYVIKNFLREDLARKYFSVLSGLFSCE